MRFAAVFVLVLAIASPAMAGPANSVIGGKKLEQDMVHNGGVGYPSTFYEWWNKGKKKLDWGLSGELVYGDWGAARTGRVRAGLISVRVSGRLIKIGLGINGILRWNLKSKERAKVTNDTAFLFKPGILISGNRFDTFTFGIKPEIGVPVSIDVHERVSVVTGGFIPLTVFFNSNADTFSVANQTILPLLIRLGVEIDASEKVAPWFFFDLGPGITFSNSTSNTGFAWRIGAGTAFWGVMGKNKNKSDAAEPVSAEPMSSEPIE
jgi:hypothetical protein